MDAAEEAWVAPLSVDPERVKLGGVALHFFL